jgi:hypothetical protein
VAGRQVGISNGVFITAGRSIEVRVTVDVVVIRDTVTEKFVAGRVSIEV